jgi:hypothetical protein
VPAPGRRGRISNRVGSVPFRDRGTGLSDRGVASILDKLDRALPELDTSIDSLIAAHLRQQPELTDDAIVCRIHGLDDPARVARVRGLLAAGHDPDTPGVNTRHLEGPTRAAGSSTPPEHSAARSGTHARCGATLAPAATPAMPSFLVTAPDGTVTRHDKYRGAMIAKVRAGPGATIAVEGSP